MRLLFLSLLTILCTCGRAQGIVIDLTAAGVGLHPVGTCDKALPDPDCSAVDGNQNITVAPGELYAFYFAWANDGAATFAEVRATDQMGNLLFAPITTPLLPGGAANISDFRDAPEVPGDYTFLVTVTATDENDRSDSEQFRYFVTVDASLPVEMTEFTATSTSKSQVNLRWKTAAEVNNQGFVVARSSNGLTFTQVGAVAGAGNVEGARWYHFQDKSAPAGRIFYRLQQTDLDGTETLSEIITVAVMGVGEVYPNPTDGIIQLRGFPEGPIVVYNALGQVVLRQHAVKVGVLNVRRLKPGNYWLRAGNEVVRFVKR